MVRTAVALQPRSFFAWMSVARSIAYEERTLVSLMTEG